MNTDVPVAAGHVNVLNAVEAEFAEMSMLSTVLLERGACGEGQPASAVTISAARDIVLDREADPALSDRIWATLVRHYRLHPRRWRPVVIWIMLPNLRTITSRLYHNWWWRVDVEDIRSDVIVGFLEALQQVDPDRSQPGVCLWWHTFRHARQACARLGTERPAADLDLFVARTADHSVNAPAEHGHFDGAARGTVDVARNATSIEGERLGSLAQRLGLRDRALGHPRARRRARIVSVRGNGTGDAA